MKKTIAILVTIMLILSQFSVLTVFAAGDPDTGEYADEVIRLVNEERAKAGLGALTTMENLTYAAELRSEELVEVFGHDRPDGSEWKTVLDEYEISYSIASENIAYGQKTPSAVVSAWMNSPGHRKNILNEEVNYIGVGYYLNGATPYWAQIFIGSDESDESEGPKEEKPTASAQKPKPQTESTQTDASGESGNIQAVEVTQVMGKGQSIDDGKLYYMRSFVAGKNTAVLVVLKNAVTVDPSGNTQYVTVSKDGKEIARLKPLGPAIQTNIIQFVPQNLKDVGSWAAGNYTITAVIENDKSSVDVKFEERMTMRVLAVPVKGNWGGEIKSTEGDWKTAGKFTQAVYPLKNGGLIWELAPELDLSDDKYDLTTDDGMFEVWQALADKQTRDNKYTLIVGFVRDRQGDGSLQGYTYGLPATIVTESDEDMLATVAHEIAHCYEIGDEYSGGSINMNINPAPYGMSGSDWYNSEEEITANKKFIKGESETYGEGSLVLEEQHAYEPYGRGLLGTMVSYMGSGAKQSQYWTTSALWEQLFKSFAHSGKQVLADQSQAEEKEWIDLIDISGVVYKDGSIRLDPSYQYEGLWEDVKEPTGTGYFVVLLDKEEKELQKVKFGVSFTANSNPPRSLDKAPFSVTLKYPQDTQFLELRYGTQTIYRKEISKNKPEVSFSPVTGRGELSGKQIIEWQGRDKDGDKLYYELWYSPSEDDWICLAKDITETAFEVDFDTLPGGKEAIFYLYATDGINTAYTESESFSVAYKAPEIMTEQKQPEVFKVTDEIYFEVDVYDPQDGYMYEPEGQIVWKDKKGEVVSEDYALLFYPYELSIGEHTFTMTATNSGGKTVSREYRFLIENDESALPQGWSREEFKEAMVLGLVDPELMYGYANNASKLDLAMTAVNLYLQIADVIEEVELSEEAPYADYEDKDGYAEMAVKYGFLTANDNKFEPQKPVTRSEVVDTFCKVLNLAGYRINQNENFIEKYTDIGTLTGISRANMACFNALGIIKGSGDNKLAPFDFATREQIVVIAKRVADEVSE
ncbi:MAG: S-layer homology domain-containing protein [Firmicutes bacterium]|nr:S-layer homology domain-containing protein [Bacillota bacterium]